MLLSSFAKNVNTLYLTYGVFTGGGGSLIYTPSILILGHYFRLVDTPHCQNPH